MSGSVERDERAHLLVAEAVAGVDDQLLSELDDRAVRSAEHRRSAALRTACRDCVDQQLHLVRHERVQAHELVLREVRRTGRRLEADIGVELVAVSGEPLADRGLAGLGLVEHTPAGDLVDVAREEVDAQREPILDAGVLDLARLEAVDDVAQLLLRRDHEPERPALLLERLGQTLEVEHALDASGDVLADLVDDEHEALRAVAASPEELQCPVGEPVVVDVGRARGLGPRVGVREVGGVDEVQRPARVVLGQRHVADLAPTACPWSLPARPSRRPQADPLPRG